jgi:hypothetical protein
MAYQSHLARTLHRLKVRRNIKSHRLTRAIQQIEAQHIYLLNLIKPLG